MASDIVVIDNVLPNKEFEQILFYFKHKVEWLYGDTVTVDIPDDPRFRSDDPTDFQFVKLIFFQTSGVIDQQSMQALKPILKFLKATVLARIKANLNTWTPEVMERDFHVDYDYGNMTAIYYLNTCNGYTLFKDGQKCESVANRICIFPGGKWHTGTTTSDSKHRMVININYWPHRPNSGVLTEEMKQEMREKSHDS